MGNLELIINILIIGLLIPTIIFAYKLNKNLTIMRQNQSSFSKLIEALNDATNKAETSIPKLKSITEHSESDLKEVVGNAKELKEDLTFINERADNLADRLEGVIKNGRNIKDPIPFKTTTTNFENSFSPSTSEFGEKETDFNIEVSKSEAEMELLKALRAIK